MKLFLNVTAGFYFEFYMKTLALFASHERDTGLIQELLGALGFALLYLLIRVSACAPT